MKPPQVRQPTVRFWRRHIMKSITAIKFLAASAVIIMLAGVAFGQSDGSITGQVKDGAGAAIAGATVRIVNPNNSVSRTATTDADGIFIAPQLPPGAYTISVEKQGFKKVEKGAVILSTSDKLNAGDFTLEVGQVTEAVQIQADAGQLQIKTESGERSDLVTNRQVRNLALNGLKILDLTKTIPGVINTSQGAQSTVTNAAGTFTR